MFRRNHMDHDRPLAFGDHANGPWGGETGGGNDCSCHEIPDHGSGAMARHHRFCSASLCPSKGIHAYIDNRVFVLAQTPQKKKLLRASRVHHHLRTPAEGTLRACVLPKKNRMLLGIPSLDITAAVSQGRTILWHVNEGSWNGQAAAKMYAVLGKSLRKRFGEKRKFHVVEDGDTKGLQSSKGKRAQTDENIQSWMLPPRSPGWMPLDYSLWDEIEGRVLAQVGYEDETKESYAARLRRTALRLPKTLVRSVVGRMKQNIKETVASRGAHTQLD